MYGFVSDGFCVHVFVFGIDVCVRVHVWRCVVIGISGVRILVSIVVSIPACHAGDPGSIPGREAFAVCVFSPFAFGPAHLSLALFALLAF